MDLLSMLIGPLIASVVAALVIMISSEIIEHNLELKHAVILAVAANLATSFISPFLAPMVTMYLPLLSMRIAGQQLAALVLGLLFWIVLSVFIMSDSLLMAKIKIASFGFIVTTIVLMVLPYVLSFVGL
ncbi:MAG: hypothetical protein JW727_05835 [Candidatus Aenigmarchaeota archaeon]|nr:hypothetical protein [Candidatus Aenigmarchaeota archaeon]